MAEYIKLPGSPSGTPEQQLQQMYSFLYQMAQTMNVNLKEIGNAALTDEETELMNRITAAIDSTGKAPELTYSYAEAESLKSLIIKTAQFVKDEADNIRAVLFGEESAEGQYGNWKRKKGLRVDVTPDGVKQTYSYAEIVQGLKTFEINAKNFIKTGFLRTENLLPVYGVAIGKDVVTFAEDGTETYNDSNKVAELTADALSFYQGGNIVAKYTGSKLSFYVGGSEIFYIQSGKIYCAQDLELASGKKLIINTTNFKVDSSGNVTITGKIAAGSGSTFAGTMSAGCITSGTMSADRISGGTLTLGGNNNANGTLVIYNTSGAEIGRWDKDGIQATTGTFRGKLEAADGTFKVDGASKNLIAGDWKIDSNGLVYNLDHGLTNFTIGDRREDWSGNIQYEANIGPSGQMINISFSNRFGGFAYLYILGTPGNASPINPDADPNETILIASTRSHVFLGSNVDPIENISVKRIGNYFTLNPEYVNEAYITNINYVNLIQNSSKKVKHDIQPLPDRSAALDRLRPVTFVYDDDPDEKVRAGLIYEDTIDVMPEICTGDESNKAIKYVELIPYLLKEIQDLRARVKALEEREEN